MKLPNSLDKMFMYVITYILSYIMKIKRLAAHLIILEHLRDGVIYALLVLTNSNELINSYIYSIGLWNNQDNIIPYAK